MNVLAIIGHIGLLIHMGNDVKGIVDNLVQKKEQFPSKAEFLVLVQDSLAFLQSGIIALPADVLAKMVEALNAVAAELQPSAPQA